MPFAYKKNGYAGTAIISVFGRLLVASLDGFSTVPIEPLSGLSMLTILLRAKHSANSRKIVSVVGMKQD
jgi:hypothetical protein